MGKKLITDYADLDAKEARDIAMERSKALYIYEEIKKEIYHEAQKGNFKLKFKCIGWNTLSISQTDELIEMLIKENYKVEFSQQLRILYIVW